MKIRSVTMFFIFAQLILLGWEVFTHYDTAVRQGALVMTNVSTTLAIVWFDRWLLGKGSRLSVVSYGLLAIAIWLDALGNFQHLYGGFWWWDRLTHTVGGMALSAGFIDLFQSYRQAGKLQVGWTWVAWMGVLVGQLVGSVYEISEWLGDMWFHTERVRGQYDTAHDLFQNLAGGLLVLFIFWIIKQQKSASLS